MALGCRHGYEVAWCLSINAESPSQQVAFVWQQVCILCAVNSMKGSQLLADAFLQDCQEDICKTPK